jgi:hypothetical protein
MAILSWHLQRPPPPAGVLEYDGLSQLFSRKINRRFQTKQSPNAKRAKAQKGIIGYFLTDQKPQR